MDGWLNTRFCTGDFELKSDAPLSKPVRIRPVRAGTRSLSGSRSWARSTISRRTRVIDASISAITSAVELGSVGLTRTVRAMNCSDVETYSRLRAYVKYEMWVSFHVKMIDENPTTRLRTTSMMEIGLLHTLRVHTCINDPIDS